MAPSAHGLHGTADLSLLTSEAPPIELPPPRFSHAIQGFAAVMDESLVMRVLAQESGIVEAIERDWPVRALRRLGRSAICWAAGPGILCNQRRIPSPKDCAASEVSRAAHRSAFGGRWQARESTCSCWTRAWTPTMLTSMSSSPARSSPLNLWWTTSTGTAQWRRASRPPVTMTVTLSASRPMCRFTATRFWTPLSHVRSPTSSLRSTRSSPSAFASVSPATVKGIVINMSLGADVGTREYTSLGLAVAQAVTVHGIVVVAAGCVHGQ